MSWGAYNNTLLCKLVRVVVLGEGLHILTLNATHAALLFNKEAKDNHRATQNDGSCYDIYNKLHLAAAHNRAQRLTTIG